MPRSRGRPDHTERNAKILAMRGEYSMGMIAQMLRVSRSTVAGVFWRHDWPLEKRLSSPGSNGSPNMCGTGRGHKTNEWATYIISFGGRKPKR